MRIDRSLLLVTLLLCIAPLSRAPAQESTSFADFFEQFRHAVVTGDILLVNVMTRFPLEMPHGVKRIRTAAELARRSNELFPRDRRALFAEAAWNYEGGGVYTLLIDEVWLYRFRKVKKEYRFVGLDNINE